MALVRMLSARPLGRVGVAANIARSRVASSLRHTFALDSSVHLVRGSKVPRPTLSRTITSSTHARSSLEASASLSHIDEAILRGSTLQRTHPSSITGGSVSDPPFPFSDAIDSASEVLTQHAGGFIRSMVLNNGTTRNSFTTSQLNIMRDTLKKWNLQSHPRSIVIRSSSPSALSAGTDFNAFLAKGGERLPSAQKDYIRSLQEVAYTLHTMTKPVIPLMDGLVSGAGAALSQGSTIRVATPETVYTHPEVSQGWFPDAGAAYHLNRNCDYPNLAMFLALTGHRMIGTDLLHAGLATHVIPADRFAIVEKDLAGDPTTSDQQLANRLVYAVSDPKPFMMREMGQLEVIRSCFGENSVEAIIESLMSHATEWSMHLAEKMKAASPYSLKITFELMRRAKKTGTTMLDVLEMERRVSSHMLNSEWLDVRPDGNTCAPWNGGATLGEVTDEQVQTLFESDEGVDIVAPILDGDVASAAIARRATLEAVDACYLEVAFMFGFKPMKFDLADLPPNQFKNDLGMSVVPHEDFYEPDHSELLPGKPIETEVLEFNRGKEQTPRYTADNDVDDDDDNFDMDSFADEDDEDDDDQDDDQDDEDDDIDVSSALQGQNKTAADAATEAARSELDAVYNAVKQAKQDVEEKRQITFERLARIRALDPFTQAGDAIEAALKGHPDEDAVRSVAGDMLSLGVAYADNNDDDDDDELRTKESIGNYILDQVEATGEQPKVDPGTLDAAQKTVTDLAVYAKVIDSVKSGNADVSSAGVDSEWLQRTRASFGAKADGMSDDEFLLWFGHHQILAKENDREYEEAANVARRQKARGRASMNSARLLRQQVGVLSGMIKNRSDATALGLDSESLFDGQDTAPPRDELEAAEPETVDIERETARYELRLKDLDESKVAEEDKW
eukprot:TRINITY_DN2053_c5_g2_i1.p1 TRINITY_DN2053_c5_g2~~TRINITY_DN2053_c5_g2_i1.p1  ORF type:complete len:904 (-),score=177.46 TRINITY_DN2053_c5_g2_i1:49-2760(-)